MKHRILIILLGLACYSSAVNNSFVWDDKGFVVLNPAIRSLAKIPSFFTDPKTVSEGSLARDVYRPVATLSFAVDYRLFKLNPMPYHLENILLHILNALLLYILLDAVFGSLPFSLIASLVFLTHPAQTEAVTWISGRSNVLFTFFYLASFIFYIRSQRKSRPVYLWLSLLFFTLSVFSKETAVTLPVLIGAYEYLFKKQRSMMSPIAKIAPYLTVAAFYIALRFCLMHEVGQRMMWGGGFYATLLTMSKALLYYIKVVIFPYTLCAGHVVAIAHSIMEPAAFRSVIVLTVIFIACAYLIKRSKTAAFAILWFFAALIPVMNIIPINTLLAERFLYLPIAGFGILLAWAILRVYGRLGITAVAFVVVLLSLYSVRTYARNFDWKDEETLFVNIVSTSPNSANAHYNLGNVYFDKARYEDAIREYSASIRLKPGYSFSHLMLGEAYEKTGAMEEAEKEYRQAIMFDPDNASAHNQLGALYYDRGEYDSALLEYEKAISLNSGYTLAYINVGNARYKLGDRQGAKAAWKNALRQDPGLEYIRKNLELIDK